METKNIGGRPRIHDRDQIAKDMLEWALLETSTNMNGFCATRKPPMAPSFITNWAKECDTFRGAYEAAKALVGMRREQMLSDGRLHLKAYDLNAKVYDHFLKEEWKQTVKFEAQVNKDVNNNTEQKQFFDDKFNSVMNQLESLSQRNKEESNINNET